MQTSKSPKCSTYPGSYNPGFIFSLGSHKTGFISFSYQILQSVISVISEECITIKGKTRWKEY